MPKDAESLQAVITALLKAERSPKDLSLISELLCEVKCCHECSAALLSRLSHSVQAKIYAAGEEICRQGEVAVGLLIVLQGRVAVAVRKRGGESFVARLGPLATIGEEAMSKEIVNNSTLTTIQPTTLCLLSRSDYLSALHSQCQQEQVARASFLHSTPLFQKITKQGVFRLAGYFRECRLKRGECFYREGDLPLAVFVIVSGEVEFLKNHIVSANSEHYLTALPGLRALNSLQPQPCPPHQSFLSLSMKGCGELFGQEEVLSGGNRSCTASCASVQCVVLGISKVDFLKRVQNREVLEKIESLDRVKREWNRSRFEDLKTAERLKQSFTDRSISPIPYTAFSKSSPAKRKEIAERRHLSSSIFPTEIPIFTAEKSISYSPLPIKPLSRAHIKQPRLRPASIVSSVRSESLRIQRSSSSLDSPLLKGILRPVGAERHRGTARFQSDKPGSSVSDYGQNRQFAPKWPL